MKHCYDQGILRAYLDETLPDAERIAVGVHLGQCTACTCSLHSLRAIHERIDHLLAAPTVEPQAALARFRQRVGATQESTASAAAQPLVVSSSDAVRATPPERGAPQRSQPMKAVSRAGSGPRRLLATVVATLVVALSLLAFPPVRAAADQLLQVFRVQSVVFVPVSQERMEQLRDLNFDKDTLFVSAPRRIGDASDPRTVASAEEASSAVGFVVEQPSNFPATVSSSEFAVMDEQVVEAQVNVESARQLLTLMGVDDVTLPDALGESPIRATMAPAVAIRYALTDDAGTAATLNLVQGRSPEVTLPDGVDLAQLGKAALRLLGMEAAQAEALSSRIDWSSTLLFPIPADIRDVRQVTINGDPGMLVGAGSHRGRHAVLYWQRGDRFFVLEGSNGIDEMALVAAAESVR